MTLNEYCTQMVGKIAAFKSSIEAEEYEGLDASTDLSEGDWDEQFYAHLGITEYDD